MNRKKRNLNYIRLKNKLRKGDIISNFEKISNSLTTQEEELFFDNVIKQHEINYKKKYKLNLKLYSCELGLLGDDFMKNLTTIKLNFKKSL